MCGWVGSSARFTVNVPLLMKLLWSTGLFAMPCQSVHPLNPRLITTCLMWVITTNEMQPLNTHMTLGLMGNEGKTNYEVGGLEQSIKQHLVLLP